MTDARHHWDDTYAAKTDTQTSWYQPLPRRSLDLIRAAAPSRSAGIIDVGGGTSRLVDELLRDGRSDLTVLDISEIAIARSRARLRRRADSVAWIVADVTRWRPRRTWDVWHDRAVFHFLTDRDAQDAYIAALKRGTHAGSAVILATFAPTGPERCSGLPVQRYSPGSLAARLGADFALDFEASEAHQTPFGTTQDFSYAAFSRR
ncbi:Methyltransferase domain-containing protein [Tistlia consotensis]|uniref:Methyltransferase domain-containing protein n=1 Tax=Tistlia consotensis USBA 355 TaxID=560819 RepID=A0A1Y6BUK9_9PROT|nr:class I SAM-dependent methyltransferase [Tistlia consotensis]SMF27864.1 Methyltransferase domain-containing protein [Tistlia consotensis USBA 355]SNR65530.1 Methyltransferase domain-containing protein [Tistlia consotensis]